MGDGFSVYVPSLDLGACKSVLKARLAAVLEFEKSYHRFLSESGKKEDAKTTAEIALGHSGDVESQYLFLEGLAKKRYKDAEEAYETSKKRFNVGKKPHFQYHTLMGDRNCKVSLIAWRRHLM